MSRSIHKPWIKEIVMELLSSPVPENVGAKLKGTRCVQILSCNEESRCITISDTELCVHAFLTTECFEGLVELYSMDTLKYSQVNLVNFCFSTVTQAAGNQDMKKLMALHVTLPLALHCFKIDYLGASDSSVMGNPRALNASRPITDLLRNYKCYQHLKERLAIAQFPLQKSLPDWEGAFDSNETFSADNPLTRAVFQQPESQNRIIQALNSFDMSHVVNTLPALLLDEGAQAAGSNRDEPAATSSGSKNRTAAAPTADATQASVGQHDFTADGWTETIREDYGDYDAQRVDWSSYWRPMGETQVPSDGEDSDPEGCMQDRDFPPESEDEDGPTPSVSRATREASRKPFASGDIEILSLLDEATSSAGPANRGFLDTGTQCTQDMTQHASEGMSQLSVGGASAVSGVFSPMRTRRQRSASQQSSVANSAASSPISSRSQHVAPSQRQGSSQVPSKAPLPPVMEEPSPIAADADSAGLQNAQSSTQRAVLNNPHLLELYQKLSHDQRLTNQPSAHTAEATALASGPNVLPAQSSAPLPAQPIQQGANTTWAPSTWTAESQSQSQVFASLQPSDESKASEGASKEGTAANGWLARNQPYITQDELGSLLEWGNEYASQFVYSLDSSHGTANSAAPAADATATASENIARSGTSFVCVDVLSGPSEPISGITHDSPAAQAPTTQADAPSTLPDTPQRPRKPPAASSQSPSQQSSSYREPSAPTPIVMINDGVSGRNAAVKHGKPVAVSAHESAADLAALEEANSLLNREISRVFGDGVRYTGTISNYEDGMFLVLYEDGDQQHLNLRDIKKCLVPLVAISARAGVSKTSSDLESASIEEEEMSSQSEVLTAPQYISSSPSQSQQPHSLSHSYSGSDAQSKRAPSMSAAPSSHRLGRPPLGSSSAGARHLHISAAAALVYSQDNDGHGDQDDDASVTSESLGLRNHANSSHSSPATAGRKRSASTSDRGPPSKLSHAAAHHGRSLLTGPFASASKIIHGDTSGSAAAVHLPDVALMSDQQLEQFCASLVIPQEMVMPPMSDYGYNYYNFLRHLPKLIDLANADAAAVADAAVTTSSTAGIAAREGAASAPAAAASERKTWNFRHAPQSPPQAATPAHTAAGASHRSGPAALSSAPRVPAAVSAASPVNYASLSDAEIAQRFPRPADARRARMQRSIQKALLNK